MRRENEVAHGINLPSTAENALAVVVRYVHLERGGRHL